MMNDFDVKNPPLSEKVSQSAQGFRTQQALQTPQAFQKTDFQNIQKSKNPTRFCQNCGSPLEDGDLFCSECGYKVEREEENQAVSIEKDTKTIEQVPITITSDRWASILQTNRIKAGKAEDDFKNEFALIKNKSLNLQTQKSAQNKKSLQPGYYIHTDTYMTQYLIIDSIEGCKVRAQVKTIFTNGGYSTEFYEGNFDGDKVQMHMVNSDLHPQADELQVFGRNMFVLHHSIQISETFEGTFGEDSISGSFSGHFSKAVVFKKC